MLSMHLENEREKISRFREALFAPNDFALTFELVPSRGGKGKAQDRALEFARLAAADKRLHAVSLTENAGGHPALSPEVLGLEINSMDLDVIIHFSCKDKNRNQMESLLFAWDRQGLQNLLVISGDYPQSGYRGHPKPVFDLDSIQALDLISRLNCQHKGRDRRHPNFKALQPTSFLKGVALSPFKLLEAELMAQYYKLHRKKAAGANYVITQLGYDARKFHEVLMYIERENLNLPVLGNVFIPNKPVVEMMYYGKIPGCVIPEKLYVEMQREFKDSDKGKKARLMRAAKLLAVLKGMGYAGAHIGGPGITFADFDFVLNRAEEYIRDWRTVARELDYWPERGFWYFDRDNDTGLNAGRENARKCRRGGSLSYKLSSLMHEQMFADKGILCPAFKRICLTLADGSLANTFAGMEHLLKIMMFNCQNCGDCTLAELAYLCPQSGCAKYLLNGACGGSRDGWCEVYPGKKRCHYVKVYERLRSSGRQGSMKDGFVPPRDWALNKSSSWVNFFRGIDHLDDDK